ncbi:MAG: TRAP transporter small permease [Ramlibacter sp.]|nr:TRAP transporter small permease [Ramlibacter sp.]MBX3658017.1 TRAP transporter small permease [Ramlibacter sp.]MCW5648691.1 TRAP transporter small permease [Ramlibacter sp.]
MVLTFLDVGGRKLLSHSITGSLEMTELLMVVVIFGALPLVSLRGEHVLFDSLDSHLPPWLLRAQKLVVDGICAVALLALAVLMWNTGNQFLASGETTAQLLILKAPFIYGMSVLCGTTGLVHLGLMFSPVPSIHETQGAAL